MQDFLMMEKGLIHSKETDDKFPCLSVNGTTLLEEAHIRQSFGKGRGAYVPPHLFVKRITPYNAEREPDTRQDDLFAHLNDELISPIRTGGICLRNKTRSLNWAGRNHMQIFVHRCINGTFCRETAAKSYSAYVHDLG
jgi:hypothetical protein